MGASVEVSPETDLERKSESDMEKAPEARNEYKKCKKPEAERRYFKWRTSPLSTILITI
jgi:hypothetical protein